MGITERRERERDELRQKIVESARDIVAEEGVHALSMRAVAERIEYSPGTIYLHFDDKDGLLREVVSAGFELMNEVARRELHRLPPAAGPLEEYRALGRAYVRFALESTGFFRVMFEIPGVPSMAAPEPSGEEAPMAEDRVISRLQQAIDEGHLCGPGARQVALVGWGLIHGLTSLYLGGHLHGVDAPEDFYELIEDAMNQLGTAWRGPAPRPEGIG